MSDAPNLLPNLSFLTLSGTVSRSPIAFLAPFAMFIPTFISFLLFGWVTALDSQSCSAEEALSIKSSVQTNWGAKLGSTCACETLNLLFPGKIARPGSDTYNNETTHYWDRKEALSPKCVFIPGSPHDVAKGVVVLKTCKSQFAVRGAGHMPVSTSGPFWYIC